MTSPSTPGDPTSAWFEQVIAACPIPLPCTDDPVAVAAYTDQVLAWVAEHHAEGFAAHSRQLALEGLEYLAEEVLEDLVDEGLVERWGVSNEGHIVYQRAERET